MLQVTQNVSFLLDCGLRFRRNWVQLKLCQSSGGLLRSVQVGAVTVTVTVTVTVVCRVVDLNLLVKLLPPIRVPYLDLF